MGAWEHSCSSVVKLCLYVYIYIYTHTYTYIHSYTFIHAISSTGHTDTTEGRLQGKIIVDGSSCILGHIHTVQWSQSYDNVVMVCGVLVATKVTDIA